MELCIISFLYEFTTGCINLSLFYSNYIFNIPTKCTYTIEHMYYYQHPSTCFGTYCAIFRENSLTCQNYCYYCWFITDIITI